MCIRDRYYGHSKRRADRLGRLGIESMLHLYDLPTDFSAGFYVTCDYTQAATVAQFSSGASAAGYLVGDVADGSAYECMVEFTVPRAEYETLNIKTFTPDADGYYMWMKMVRACRRGDRSLIQGCLLYTSRCV